MLLFLACFFETKEIEEEETQEEDDSKFLGSLGFEPISAYFGGSHIIFFDEDIPCEELHWVDLIYRNGEAPYEPYFTALQISFNDSEVIEGSFAAGGEAPIRATYLQNMEEGFEVLVPSEGVLESTKVGENWTLGSFEFLFAEESIEGTYNIPFCDIIP